LLIGLSSERGLRCQTTVDVNFKFFLDGVRLIGHTALDHIIHVEMGLRDLGTQ
jgi:hypothetical protein